MIMVDENKTEMMDIKAFTKNVNGQVSKVYFDADDIINWLVKNAVNRENKIEANMLMNMSNMLIDLKRRFEKDK